MGISLFLEGSKRHNRHNGNFANFLKFVPEYPLGTTQPQSARLSEGAGVKSLFGQCPNAEYMNENGYSLRPPPPILLDLDFFLNAKHHPPTPCIWDCLTKKNKFSKTICLECIECKFSQKSRFLDPPPHTHPSTCRTQSNILNFFCYFFCGGVGLLNSFCIFKIIFRLFW